MHRGGASVRVSAIWRADEGNGLTFVPAVDAEIFSIHYYDAVARIEIAHADQAKVGEIGLTISIATGESCELRQVILAVERQCDQPVADHCDNEGYIT